MARTVSVSGEDAKSASEGGTFKPWPAGNYLGTIVDVKPTTIGRAKTKNAQAPALNVTVKFTDSNTGKGEGKKFIAWRVPDFPKWPDSGKSAFLFYQFYKAVGVEFPKGDGDVELPDLEELLDVEIGLRLTVVDKQDAQGNVVGEQNNVQGFFPASEGVGEAVADADDDEVADEFTL